MMTIPPAGRQGGVVQGRAVAAHGHVDHAGPVAAGDLLRAVGRAVVADDDLAGDAGAFEEARALRMQVSSVSASFRQGITIDSSGAGATTSGRGRGHARASRC